MRRIRSSMQEWLLSILVLHVMPGTGLSTGRQSQVDDAGTPVPKPRFTTVRRVCKDDALISR